MLLRQAMKYQTPVVILLLNHGYRNTDTALPDVSLESAADTNPNTDAEADTIVVLALVLAFFPALTAAAVARKL